jgi:hypothetical protein
MRQYMKYFLLSLAVVAVLLAAPGRVSAQPGVVAHMGALPDGATFLIEVPVYRNGTLFLAAVQNLIERLKTGKWRNLGAADLNAAAASLGPDVNVPFPSAFVDFKPAQYLRPFDGEAEECELGRSCRELDSQFRFH